MGILMEDTIENIALLSLFKALSDDTRLSIVLLLRHQGLMCVCDIYECLGVSQPKVSRHLAMLRKVGLVSDERKGTWVYYQINPKLTSNVINILDAALPLHMNSPEFKMYLERIKQQTQINNGCN
jgi:ArsR family transcriptional regulator